MSLKRILPLIKKSAKKSFVLLRKKSPLFCISIKAEIKVTKLFFAHISHNKKREQHIEDLIERLLIIPFIEDIIAKGKVIQKRFSGGRVYYRISLPSRKTPYSVIIVKDEKDTLLLSCFIDQFHQRKNPS